MACLSGFSLNVGGQEAWTVVIYVDCVDFVDGGGGDCGLLGWCSGCQDGSGQKGRLSWVCIDGPGLEFRRLCAGG